MTIVVTGHGAFASGVKTTVDLIFGETENMEYVDFPYDSSPNQLFERFSAIYNDCGGNVIFLVDLAGGTPFNQASRLLHQYGKQGVIGGINIGMIFAAIDVRENFNNPLVFCQKIKQMGIESIGILGEVNNVGYNLDSGGGI